MKIRLEFGHTRAQSFPWVLRLCKTFPTFKAFEEEGLQVYSIEVTDKDPSELAALEAIHNRVRTWKQVAYFMDDKLSSASAVYCYIWDRRNTRRRALYRGDAKGFIDTL